ncbi:MAG TPA: hypothetical protein VK625_20730, partial [Flavitalea sp.]|nr:hypothetical protein [Flavitalea sp.]
LNFIRINELIHFEGTAPEYLKTLTPAQLTACLENLESDRILRMDDSSVELAHDILATLIDKERPQEQRRLNDIRRQVISSYDEFRLTHEYLTPKQLTIYEDAIDKLDLQPEVARFFRTSKKYRNKQRRFKWGSIAFAILALFIFSGFEIRKGVRNDAFVKYLGNIDTLPNKEDALRIFKDIRSKVIIKEDTWVKKKFLQVFQSQDIQSQFSVFNDTISITSLKASEIDVSDDAHFIVIKETNDSVRSQIAGSGKYRILDSAGRTVKYFDSVYYAYFVDRSSTILLAKYIDPSHGRGRNVLRLNGYPNTGILYNCETQREETIRFTNPRAYLYPAEEIQLVNNNENDSYRIRYTASGNLVVPFVDLGDNRSGSKKIRIIRHDNSYKEIASDVSISSSKDKLKLMTGTWLDNGNRSFNLTVYDERGNLLNNKYPGVDFGDFTNRGSVMFSSGTKLSLQNETGDIRDLTARSKISYAYADGDEKVVLVQAKDNLELHNDADKIYTIYHGKLIDANFEKRLFITLNTGGSDNGPGVQSDTLWRRNFSGKNDAFFTGKEGTAFTGKEGIAQVIYNKQKNQLLVLLTNYRLLLLNDSLKVQAGLQLTANDLYGFADDGNKVYYVRDKYLSVFNNDLNLINVFSYKSSIDKMASRKTLTRDLSAEDRLRYKVPE